MVGLIERASDRFLGLVVPTVPAQAARCWVGGQCRTCNCYSKKYYRCCVNGNGVIDCNCTVFVSCRAC